jgi:hypothetical protein
LRVSSSLTRTTREPETGVTTEEVIVKRFLIVLAVGAVLTCPAAFGSEDRAPDRDSKSGSTPAKEAAASGEVPSAAEERTTDAGPTYPPALSPLNRSSRDLEVVIQPDGSKIVDLQRRFQHATVVRILEDGSFAITCVDSHEHVTKRLEEDASASAASPPEK